MQWDLCGEASVGEDQNLAVCKQWPDMVPKPDSQTVFLEKAILDLLFQ